MTEPTALDRPLDGLTDAITDVAVASRECAVSVEDLALCLATIRDAVRQLRDLDDEITDLIADVLPHDNYEVEGVGVLTVKRAARSPRWDSEQLLRILVARALDERRYDPETGETEPPWEPVVRVIEETTPICTPSFGWRVGALKKCGIDIDQYRESQGVRTSVVIA